LAGIAIGAAYLIMAIVGLFAGSPDAPPFLFMVVIAFLAPLPLAILGLKKPELAAYGMWSAGGLFFLGVLGSVMFVGTEHQNIGRGLFELSRVTAPYGIVGALFFLSWKLPGKSA
jgi:hypothetical protein